VKALVPYFEIPILELMDGWVVIDSWATLVCIGFIAGLEIARARAIRAGLDVRDLVDGAVVTVGMGFVVGHIVHVLAYNPHLIDEEGWITLARIWGGFSSYGGFLGAGLGSVLFYKVVRKRSWLAHCDAICFGFPFAWAFGRLGCFTAHDHIGAPSDFFLAVRFPGGSRHDLGLYEALWTILIAVVFFIVRNRSVRPGFFLALFAVLYSPIRFLLDFLRNEDLSGADVRWGGLTPAQYGSIFLFLLGLWLVTRLRLDPLVSATPLPDDKSSGP